MTQLSELYDGDKFATKQRVRVLRHMVSAPHPLHGVDYADGVILCGRVSCQPCREYRNRRVN